MFQALDEFFWTCRICGGSPQANFKICPYCLKQVEAWFLSHTKLQDQDILSFARFRFGFLWSPKDTKAKQNLIYSLKQNPCDKAWTLLADYFLSQNQILWTQSKWLVLPLPSRQPHDHAWGWARALARGVGGRSLEFFSILEKEATIYHHKNRQDRQKRTLSLRRPEVADWLFTQQQQGYRVALADDVVTTGATVRAGWEALKRPSNLEVWALSHRITLRN